MFFGVKYYTTIFLCIAGCHHCTLCFCVCTVCGYKIIGAHLAIGAIEKYPFLPGPFGTHLIQGILTWWDLTNHPTTVPDPKCN